MKKIALYIAFLAISMVFFACSDNAEELLKDEASEQPRAKSRTLTPEEAKQNVMAFLEALENATPPESRGSDYKKRVISDIQVIGNPISSRSDFQDASLDSSLYIFNLKDSMGFVIGGTQENQPPVYAIIDEGNYSYKMFREETNTGFKWFVSQCIPAVDKYEDGPIIYPPVQSVEWEILSVKEPLVKAKWGQGETSTSYGKLFKNHITGCSVTAAAQLLYNFSTPSKVQWIESDGRMFSQNISWPRIKMDCKQYGGKLHPNLTPNSMNEVAHLCRYLGLGFKVNDSNPDKTSAKPNNIWSWFKNHSGLNVTNLKPYNGTDVVNSIKQNKIIYTIGYESKNGGNGHAWIIDGCVDAKRYGVSQKLVFCNWGKDGDKNGYYLSGVFDQNSGPIMDENGDICGSEPYYKYNLQYFVVSQ